MKKIVYLSVGLLIGMGVLTSCSKDDDPKLSNTQMLAGTTSKSYVMTSMKLNDVEMISFTEACNRDDLYTFYADKKFQSTEGATKCDAADDNLISEGTWSLSSDEKSITYDGATVAIKELTNSKLVVEEEEDGFKYTITLSVK
jgi:hypothetical protein